MENQNSLINKLIKIADSLDEEGLMEEANMADAILNEYIAGKDISSSLIVFADKLDAIKKEDMADSLDKESIRRIKSECLN